MHKFRSMPAKTTPALCISSKAHNNPPRVLHGHVGMYEKARSSKRWDAASHVWYIDALERRKPTIANTTKRQTSQRHTVHHGQKDKTPNTMRKCHSEPRWSRAPHLPRQRREVFPAPRRRHRDQTAEIGRIVVAPRAAGDDAEGSRIVKGRRNRNVKLEVESCGCKMAAGRAHQEHKWGRGKGLDCRFFHKLLGPGVVGRRARLHPVVSDGFVLHT